MHKKHQKKLKIISLAIICFCLIVGYSIFQFKTNFFNIEIQQKQLELEKTAEIKAKSVQQKYNEMINSLTVLSNIIIDNYPLSNKSIKEQIFLLSKVGHFDYIGISDDTGNAIDSNMIQINVKDRDYFQDAMLGKTTISDVIVSQVDNKEEVQVISVPIHHENSIIGVVFGIINIKTMDQLLENETGSDIYTQIVDSKGNYITKTQTKDSLIKYDNVWDDFTEFNFIDSNINSIKNNINNGKSGSFSFEINNEKRISFYMPLGLKGYYIFSTINREYIDSWAAIINKHIIQMITEIVLAFSILLIALAWFIRSLEKEFQETIIQKKEKEKAIYQKQAEIDGLTGLYNSTTIKNKIDEFLNNPQTQSNNHLFFLMDLDNFKQINDNLGHQIGDEVLKDVANTLKTNLRETDIIGRLGGDEFAVLMTNTAEFENMQNTFIKICKLLEKNYTKDNTTIKISASLGIVELPKYGNSFQDIYSKADEALYEVKRNHKNGYKSYKP